MLTLCALALAACGGTGGRGFANCIADAASASPKQHIDGCTLVIDSGRYQGKDLAGIYYNRGFAYHNLYEYRRAIEDYDQALRLYPVFSLAYINRGWAYSELGEYRRAIEDYDQVLRLDDPAQQIRAYNNRGIAYKHLGDFERAVADWERAIQIVGAQEVKNWQRRMKGKGHYAGAINGVFGPDMPGALLACAADPACGVKD
jgi:tetratricopeptide (TPR) repeat protein